MAKSPQPKESRSYAGLGFQLVGIAIGIVFAGKKLDEYFNYESFFLLIAVFIAVFAVMYILIKKLG